MRRCIGEGLTKTETGIANIRIPHSGNQVVTGKGDPGLATELVFGRVRRVATRPFSYESRYTLAEVQFSSDLVAVQHLIRNRTRRAGR